MFMCTACPLDCGRNSKRKTEFNSSQSTSTTAPIEFRIVFLHVRSAVLLPKLLDHGIHSFGIGDGFCPEFRLRVPRINPDRRVLEHVLVPLRLRALHWQEVDLFPFQHEPDWDRDRLPGLPADHADLNLAVAGEA